MAEAQKLIKQDEVRPTEIGLTTPISKPIPTGKNIVYINCGVPSCVAAGQVFAGGAKILGWNFHVINTDGSPAQVQNAWVQILREKPQGVIYSGTPRVVFNQYLVKAKAAGIAVVAAATADPPTDGLDYVFYTPAQAAAEGSLMATWIIANSNGSPNVVWANLPDYAILSGIYGQLKNGIHAVCSSCTVDELNIPLTALGTTAPDLIVSYLRAHPDVKYLALNEAESPGLSAALRSAGLDDVKIIGDGPDVSTLSDVAASSPDDRATIAFPYYEGDYAQLDALARIFAGVPLVPNFYPRLWILDRDNLPSTTELFPFVADYQSQFEKLWNK